MEDMDRRYSGLTKLGLGVLACTTSALAVCKSWGDAGSVAFVLAADAALVLLFACLRELENRRRCRAGGAPPAAGSAGRLIKLAAVWALTTLLTAMFAGYASSVAPLVVVVGAVVFFLCLREFFGWAEIGLLGGGHYAELLKMGFGAVACDSALAHHRHARGDDDDDAGSLAFVLVAYVGFLTLTWLFLRRFDGRARGAGAGAGQ